MNSGEKMNPSSESYDAGLLQKDGNASQPLDLKKSLRIRDGLELSHPKAVELHIMQLIRANLNRFGGICFN